MQSSHEWPRKYQENILPELIFDEPLDVTHTTASPPSDTTLSPKGGIGKPTRVRSRASKKVPMTLLNANANNFRALVQKFTGCHSASPTLGNFKGPINLNFAQYNYSSSSSKKSEGHQQHDESDQSLFSFGTNNNIAHVTTTSTIPTGTINGHNRELFVSTVNYDSTRPDDPLSLDDFDMDNLSIQELPGSGDDYALPGTSHDDFWGY